MCVCRFEFSVSMVELHRRTLDVAVKNGGSILSKHKGLLGKVAPICFEFHPCIKEIIRLEHIRFIRNIAITAKTKIPSF